MEEGRRKDGNKMRGANVGDGDGRNTYVHELNVRNGSSAACMLPMHLVYIYMLA